MDILYLFHCLPVPLLKELSLGLLHIYYFIYDYTEDILITMCDCLSVYTQVQQFFQFHYVLWYGYNNRA